MKNGIQDIRTVSTGSVGSLLFFLYLLLTVLPYTDLMVDSVRKPNWVLSLILAVLAVRKGMRNGHLVSPSPWIFLLMLAVCAWKLIEAARSPGEAREAFATAGDFVSYAVVCFVFVPNYFSARGFSKMLATTSLLIFLCAIALHPFVPDVSLAGWDKGESWAFAHPNIAAMVGLTIVLAAAVSIVMRPSGVFRNKLPLLMLWIGIFLVALTNSRTVIVCMVLVITMIVLRVPLSRVWSKSGVHAKAIRFIFSVFFLVSTIFFVLAIFFSFTYGQLDSLTSGRLLFWIQLLESVQNKYVGVGLLPPGENLIYDVQSHGAGIDGLYANVIYSEGYVGLFLLIILFVGFWLRLIKVCKGNFPFLLIIPAVAVLYGITETHFWLRPSPLSIYVLGVLSCFSAVNYRTRFVPTMIRDFRVS